MRKARLLSTVAATLLLTVGAASAQDHEEGRSARSRPGRAAERAGREGGAGHEARRAEGRHEKAPETTGQAPKASDADKPAPPTRAMDKGAVDKGAARTKGSPDAKVAADVKAKSQRRAKSGRLQSRTPVPPKAPTTTGQGAAAGSAKLSTEQRSKITTIIKQQKVEPAQLNVSVSVGTRVPDSVRFYPLPVEVFVIYPEWRGYDYILVGDEILVIDPRTHEIVAILEA